MTRQTDQFRRSLRVLGLIIAEMLFKAHPTAQEGELSVRLNALVNAETCASVADEIGLHKFIRTGSDIKTLTDKRLLNVRADVIESLIATIYLDGGIDALDGGAVELHLLADMPVERAGDQALHRLRDVVYQPGRAGIHRPDGGHLRLGGVAGVDERHHVRHREADGAGGGVACADAVADLPDQRLELFGFRRRVLSACHVSCSRWRSGGGSIRRRTAAS